MTDTAAGLDAEFAAWADESAEIADEAVRGLASTRWGEDWNCPEDAVYDLP